VAGKDRDEESGKYQTTYSDSEFIDAIKQLDGLAGTAEIAEEVGCTQRTAYTRLTSLEYSGKINSREIGNSLVWLINR
jgi:GTP-sensing pleiotropic transcriptional regulator CodY